MRTVTALDVLPIVVSRDACARDSPPSFATDIAPTFYRHCASMPDCHGAHPTHSVRLDLRPDAAWSELVAHPSLARHGAARVVPGDPDASFLIDKLTGTLRHDEGKPMPLDPDTGVPIDPTPLGPCFVDHVLRPWIANGAPQN